jgi:hypothetical protein
MFRHAVSLLGVPVAGALLGWLIGFMIRGRRPRIEVERPRLAISCNYLRDAHNKSLSQHTRMRCAFEASYFCLCEVAAKASDGLPGISHPSAKVAETGMTALNSSDIDRQALTAMMAWSSSTSPSLPDISIEEACVAAERIHAATLNLLSSTQ